MKRYCIALASTLALASVCYGQHTAHMIGVEHYKGSVTARIVAGSNATLVHHAVKSSTMHGKASKADKGKSIGIAAPLSPTPIVALTWYTASIDGKVVATFTRYDEMQAYRIRRLANDKQSIVRVYVGETLLDTVGITQLKFKK